MSSAYREEPWIFKIQYKSYNNEVLLLSIVAFTAFDLYSESQNKKNEEFSGADFEVDNTPLTDETLKEMEGYPSDSDSDGLEIDVSLIKN